MFTKVPSRIILTALSAPDRLANGIDCIVNLFLGEPMRLLLIFLMMAFVAGTGLAFADVYDEVWIKQCIQDNQSQGQSAETIRIYCTCMNEHMLNSETRSITTWEKTHPEEMEYCADLAGWKGH